MTFPTCVFPTWCSVYQKFWDLTIRQPSKHGGRNYGDSRKSKSFRVTQTEIEIPALPTHWLWKCLLQEGLLGYAAVTNIPETQGLTTRPISCSRYKSTPSWWEALLPDILPPEPRLMESLPPEMPPLAWAMGEDEALTFHWLKQIPKEVQSYHVPRSSTKNIWWTSLTIRTILLDKSWSSLRVNFLPIEGRIIISVISAHVWRLNEINWKKH